MGYSSETSGNSSEPRNFRLLSDVYDEMEEIEVSDELLLLGVEESKTYEQENDSGEWNEAMKIEIMATEKNKTWVLLTDLPPGHKLISLKWVCKIKKDTNGEIVK